LAGGLTAFGAPDFGAVTFGFCGLFCRRFVQRAFGNLADADANRVRGDTHAFFRIAALRRHARNGDLVNAVFLHVIKKNKAGERKLSYLVGRERFRDETQGFSWIFQIRLAFGSERRFRAV